MDIIRPYTKIEPTRGPVVLLMGPIPKIQEHAPFCWHPLFLRALEVINLYQSCAFVPLPEDRLFLTEIERQEERFSVWTDAAVADVTASSLGYFLFWIPKNETNMTSENTEKRLRQLLTDGLADKVIVGIPPYAEAVENIKALCAEHKVAVHDSIDDVCYAFKKAIYPHPFR